MRDVSIAPRSRADARIADYLERQARRVRTTPPGTCPLVVLLSMVQAAAAQTCGKCVPCRDGLPRLAALLERLVACEADEKDLEDVQALADTVRATSDCAIGYEAATALLDGLEDFADEVKSDLQVRACAAGVGQTVPCETLCPAHADVPCVHRAGGRRALCGGRERGAQGQPVSHRLFVRVRTSLRAAVPPHAARRARQHPRHQALRGGRGAGRPGATASPRSGHRAHGRRRGRRAERAFLRVLPGTHGAPRHGVRGARAAGRHDALRHPRLPLPPRAAGRGRPRHSERRRHNGTLRHGRRGARDARRGRHVRRRVRGHRRAGGQAAGPSRRGRRGRVFGGGAAGLHRRRRLSRLHGQARGRGGRRQRGHGLRPHGGARRRIGGHGGVPAAPGGHDGSARRGGKRRGGRRGADGAWKPPCASTWTRSDVARRWSRNRR